MAKRKGTKRKLTVVPAYATPVFKNHGNDKPSRISNMLLPKQFEIAISPIPTTKEVKT
jgi:hypothetical protein